MHEVTCGLENMYGYLEAILVASSSEKQHCAQLHAPFDRLSKHGVTIIASKSYFEKSSVTYAGHIISYSGITRLPDKVAAIRGYAEPHSYRHLHQFVAWLTSIDVLFLIVQKQVTAYRFIAGIQA